MILTKDEAKHYSCCMMDKKCDADGCMAWVEVGKELELTNKEIELPCQAAENNIGYCMRVNHVLP